MRSGDLRHRITVEKPTVVSDNMGGETTTWVEHGTVWAGVWPLKAREQLDNMRMEMEITHRIRLRYLAGILPKWRVKFGSRYFDIESIINPDERNIYLELLCKEKV